VLGPEGQVPHTLPTNRRPDRALLAVPAQSLPAAWPWDAGAQPRGGPPASDRRCDTCGGRPITPSLDPAFVALNHGTIPIRARSDQELATRVRRAEDHAGLGPRVVMELYSESHAIKPSTRAITRRAQRAHRRLTDRQQRGDRRRSDLGPPHSPCRSTRRSRAGDGFRCPLTCYISTSATARCGCADLVAGVSST
jgi:hypothetical protein